MKVRGKGRKIEGGGEEVAEERGTRYYVWVTC